MVTNVKNRVVDGNLVQYIRGLTNIQNRVQNAICTKIAHKINDN